MDYLENSVPETLLVFKNEVNLYGGDGVAEEYVDGGDF